MAAAIRLTSLVVVLATGIPTGCSDTVATVIRDESLPLQTDRLSYEAVHVSGEGAYQVYGFEVVATFTNHTERTVYLDRCGPTSTTPMFGMRGVGFDAAYDPAWGCVGHNQQFVLGPGQARVDTLRINGPNEWSREGEPRGKLDGLFELQYGVRFCPGECANQAPDAAGASNQFRVSR